MATKKHIELKGFSEDELSNEIEQTVNAYNKLKFDHAVKGLDNPLSLRDIRRDVARLRTEQRRRQIEAMSAEELAGRSKKRARRK